MRYCNRAHRVELGLICWLLLCCVALGAEPLDTLQRVERALEAAQRAKPSERKVFLQQAERALAPLPPAAREPLETPIVKGEIPTALRSLRDYRTTLQAPPAPVPDAAKTKAQLEAIFAEPDMQIPPKSLMERITESTQRALETLARWVQRLFSRLGGSGLVGMTPLLQWLVIVLLILTLALTASYILGRVRIGRRVPSPAPALDAAFRDARTMSALEWRELARQLTSSQQWSLALRAYYMGMLRLLHEERLLDYDPALTNWEHLQRLRQSPPPRFATAPTPLPAYGVRAEAYRLLRPLTLQFEAVWYGGATPTHDALEGFEKAFENLLEMMRIYGNSA
ncbi:MAG: hypothetical protein KatS3mg019_0446 [Fimbriimonadales bacterium]|nr:MAG: hypothetical protein KatS3mg019_0446 [Fimbriimonadales bacterium]